MTPTMIAAPVFCAHVTAVGILPSWPFFAFLFPPFPSFPYVFLASFFLALIMPLFCFLCFTSHRSVVFVFLWRAFVSGSSSVWVSVSLPSVCGTGGANAEPIWACVIFTRVRGATRGI